MTPISAIASVGALALLATGASTIAAPAPGSRIVKCEIYSKGPGMDGRCRFTPHGRGSFTLSSDSGDLIPETAIKQVRVVIVARNRAQIYGLGAPGKPDTAIREAKDPACWVSNRGNVTVCAR